MGKNYFGELSDLDTTYQWARTCAVDPLVRALDQMADTSLLAVGSGGSYSAACYATKLHEEFAEQLARQITPLELANTNNKRHLGILVLTARGMNPDSVDAVKHAARSEPAACTVVCLRRGSKAVNLARSWPWIEVIEFEPPIRRDGFLATSSVLAFTVLLLRGYSELFGLRLRLPRKLSRPRLSIVNSSTMTNGEFLSRSTFATLHGSPWGAAAAMDLESKFTEGALAQGQPTDYRNFAHGRHNWLSRFPDTTSVLALVTPDEEVIAQKTLKLIPRQIPTARMTTKRPGALGGIELLVGVMHLVGDIASARGMDPGQPTVPRFGRAIYRLGVSVSSSKVAREVAIQRKQQDLALAPESRTRKVLLRYLNQFTDRLAEARFGGIVFDYDGTLCSPDYRFDPLPSEVTDPIVRLLQEGIDVGIATGRGRSVRVALTASIPRDLWPRVVVGYYNGARVAMLSDSPPDRTAKPSGILADFAKALAKDPIIGSACEMEARSHQLTVKPNERMSLRKLHRIIQELANSTSVGLTIVRSTYSVDVLAPGVSKRTVVDCVATRVAERDSALRVLCLGDSGRWDGNDLSLLTLPYSLTVRDSPHTPTTGWNLTRISHLNVQGTMDYLHAINLAHGSFRINVPRLVKGII